MTTETRDFATFVADRFGGKLTHGSHNPDGAACFHEALNVYQGHQWSDNTSGTLDLRSLNDAPWSSDEARTNAMLPLGAIALGWPSWPPEKRQAWAKAVSEGVIRRILPPTLRRVAELVPDKAPDLIAAALRCETDGNESAVRSAAEAARSAAWSARSAAVRSAAWSARSAAAWSATWSARSAAEAAAWSAEAAGSARSAEAAVRSAAEAARSAAEAARSAEAAAAEAAAADVPLVTLCQIMVEAAT